MQLRKIALWSRPSRMINTLTETSHSKSGDLGLARARPLSLRLSLEILLRQDGVMTIDDSAAAFWAVSGKLCVRAPQNDFFGSFHFKKYFDECFLPK